MSARARKKRKHGPMIIDTAGRPFIHQVSDEDSDSIVLITTTTASSKEDHTSYTELFEMPVTGEVLDFPGDSPMSLIVESIEARPRSQLIRVHCRRLKTSD
jgi:hypothetical protein